MKKDTRELQNFEKSLLKGYREYLNRLEKLVSKLFKKKGDTRMRSKVSYDNISFVVNTLLVF